MAEEPKVINHDSPAVPRGTTLSEAIKINVCLQVAGVLFASVLLDGGAFARIFWIACIAQWIGVGLILWRRKISLTVFDRVFLKYGVLILLLVAIALEPLRK